MLVAYKAMPALSTTTSGVNGLSLNETKAKAVGSGLFTYWVDYNSVRPGEQEAVETDIQMDVCLEKCSNSPTCAVVVMTRVGTTTLSTASSARVNCDRRRGDNNQAQWIHSVTKADKSRLKVAGLPGLSGVLS